MVKKEKFGNRKIKDIKVSDAKLWFIKMHNDGRGYSTITSVRGVVKPAFQMAYEEEIIRRNPFDFKLDVIPNDSKKREALSPKQQEIWMSYIRDDKTYCKYYDEFVVLLETGTQNSRGKYYVEKTKTECGCRYIPMTDNVYQSLKNILTNRPKVKKEVIIDGYARFIMLDKNQNPKVTLHLENEMRWALKKYKKLYPETPLPHITPHVFRHTFCTNMANAGMDLKSLQYLMGHSDAGVTMNVYAHNSYDKAEESMCKIMKFPRGRSDEKQRMSG